MTPLKVRILLADDHAVVRQGLRMLVDAQPDLEVVAEAGTGADAIDTALQQDVDLAILDIAMPRMTGLHAARELKRRQPKTRILVLSMHENEQYLYEALEAGASGYVAKTVPTAISSRRVARRCEASGSSTQVRCRRWSATICTGRATTSQSARIR